MILMIVADPQGHVRPLQCSRCRSVDEDGLTRSEHLGIPDLWAWDFGGAQMPRLARGIMAPKGQIERWQRQGFQATAGHKRASHCNGLVGGIGIGAGDCERGVGSRMNPEDGASSKG